MKSLDVLKQSFGSMRSVFEALRHADSAWLKYILAICIASSFNLQAGPITVFSLPFTLTNESADGFANVSPDGLTLVLTGGNDGSGLPGTTALTTTALYSGLVSFNYSYSTLDKPGFDTAGYLLQGTFFQLAMMDGISGSTSFPVGVGQTFGFRVATVDNEGEPGILTVSDLISPNPEPASLVLGLTGLAMVALKYRRGHVSDAGVRTRGHDFARNRRTDSLKGDSPSWVDQ